MKVIIVFLNLFLALTISFSVSCSDTACPAEYKMGTFHLLGTSRDLMPYKDSIVNLVFRDSIGNEIHGTATRLIPTGFGNTYTQVKCPDNPDQDIKVSAILEGLEYTVAIPDQNLAFKIRFSVRPNFEDYQEGFIRDIGYVILPDTIQPGPNILYSAPPQIVIVLNQRNDPFISPGSNIPSDTVKLLQSVFSNVYMNLNKREEIEFYYNHGFGLIGFRKNPTGMLYVFDRFE